MLPGRYPGQRWGAGSVLDKDAAGASLARTDLGRRRLQRSASGRCDGNGELLRMEIVKRSDDMKGFVVLPRRWVLLLVRAQPAARQGFREPPGTPGHLRYPRFDPACPQAACQSVGRGEPHFHEFNSLDVQTCAKRTPGINRLRGVLQTGGRSVSMRAAPERLSAVQSATALDYLEKIFQIPFLGQADGREDQHDLRARSDRG